MDRKFVITTDSGCDLPIQFLKDNDVKAVFLSYSIDGESHNDIMEEENSKKLYSEMRQGKIAKTSQATSSEFIDAWKDINEPILNICLSSGLSNTYNNTLLAKKEILEKDPTRKIESIDSLMGSLGIGMLVIEAIALRDKGLELEEAAKIINDMRLNINAIYTTTDLTYFCRGGRISKVSALLGSILFINPVMRVKCDGTLYISEKIRGKKKASRFIIDEAKRLAIEPEKHTLYMCHADCFESAKELAEKIKEEVGFKDIVYTLMGATIGTHTGPGLRSIFFYGSKREK